MLDGRWRADVERGLEPVGQGLHRAGITADGLTVIGLVVRRSAPRSLIADGHLVLGVFGVVLDRAPRHPRRLRGAPDSAGPVPAARSSTRSPTASPTPCSSAALRGTSPRRARPAAPCWPSRCLALSMLITYERAKAEIARVQARGGLMERAERIVLLGVGLAFDILVPVLWMMLVLTALTAVQRFVKVWRQASPERPASPTSTHHHAARAPPARAGSPAQWRAAHRPQIGALRRVALRLAPPRPVP